VPFAAPIYDPGQALTGRATGAAVVGARFLKAVGPKVNGGNIPVAHATATDEPIGVSQRDAAQNDAVAFYASGHVLYATAATQITAGAAVQLAAAGKVAPYTSGRKVGVAVESASGDGVAFLVQVQL
jgi:hypothetical protein